MLKVAYSKIYNYHLEGKFSLTIVASLQSYEIPYGVCKLNKNGNLEEIVEKPEYNLLVNSGMYLINSNIIKFVPNNTYFQMTDLINTLKINNHKIGVFPVSKKSWFDVGQWEQYKNNIDNINLFFQD